MPANAQRHRKTRGQTFNSRVSFPIAQRHRIAPATQTWKWADVLSSDMQSMAQGVMRKALHPDEEALLPPTHRPSNRLLHYPYSAVHLAKHVFVRVTSLHRQGISTVLRFTLLYRRPPGVVAPNCSARKLPPHLHAQQQYRAGCGARSTKPRQRRRIISPTTRRDHE